MWDWLRGRVEKGTAAGEIGSRGERRAEAFLKRTRGLRVIVRNWHSPRDRRDELDLVGREGEVLVFVEVKSRSPGARVSGFHAVNRRKKKVLRRAIDAYLKGLPRTVRPTTFRFDIVEVCSQASPDDADIRHYENVPLFSKFYF